MRHTPGRVAKGHCCLWDVRASMSFARFFTQWAQSVSYTSSRGLQRVSPPLSGTAQWVSDNAVIKLMHQPNRVFKWPCGVNQLPLHLINLLLWSSLSQFTQTCAITSIAMF